jgi:hypothetical protein
MYRLVHLTGTAGTTDVVAATDGYTSERAAWDAYSRATDKPFGIGQYDEQSTLIELIIDPVCPVIRPKQTGPRGRLSYEQCQNVVVAVNEDNFRRYCRECGNFDGLVAVENLSLRFGVFVRAATAEAREHEMARFLTLRSIQWWLVDELPTRITEPAWRARVCQTLEYSPFAVIGVVTAVRRLDPVAVVELYPHLRALADELPGRALELIYRGSGDPNGLTSAAAARMGLLA